MDLAWSRECRGSPAWVPNQHMQPTPLALLPLRLGSELALNAVKGQALVVTILPGGDQNAEAKSSQMRCGGSGGRDGCEPLFCPRTLPWRQAVPLCTITLQKGGNPVWLCQRRKQCKQLL